MTRRVLIPGLALTIVATLAACGGDDDDTATTTSGAGPAAELVVEARDIAFGEKAYEATAGSDGQVSVEYVNKGQINHTLLVEGLDGVKLEVVKKGERATGSAVLAPGEYTIYCDVPGHRAAGMEATLTVS